MRPQADYHTHTRWSHASGSISDNLRAAEQMGLQAVGIAEHGPNLLFVGVPRRRWPALRQTVAGTRSSSTRLLFNMEANVISIAGDIDLPPAVKDDLDMLLVGLHPRVVPVGLEGWWTYYGLRWLGLLSRPCRHRLYDAFTQALVSCVQKHRVDIVVHPGYGLPIDSGELAGVCAKRGTRLEINCRHLEAIARDISRAAKASDVEFVISSDAHHPREIGGFEAGCRFVDSLGIDRERIINVAWQEKAR